MLSHSNKIQVHVVAWLLKHFYSLCCELYHSGQLFAVACSTLWPAVFPKEFYEQAWSRSALMIRNPTHNLNNWTFSIREWKCRYQRWNPNRSPERELLLTCSHTRQVYFHIRRSAVKIFMHMTAITPGHRTARRDCWEAKMGMKVLETQCRIDH